MNNEIAVFDSGVGGLTTLKKLRQALPNEDFNYFADNFNAPYGSKTDECITELTFAAMEKITAFRPKAIIVACNTVTGVCIEKLRDKYNGIPIFGIQPAVKPAIKDALVFTTYATADSVGFKNFMQKYGEKAFVMPLEKAAGLIEKNCSDGEFESYLRAETEGVDFSKFSSVVLGCTHYVFKKQVFQKITGLPVFDGNDGLARHVKEVLLQENLLSKQSIAGSVFFNLSSCETAEFEKYVSLFNGFDIG